MSGKITMSLREWRAMETYTIQLRTALEESVKLQSHYAGLLNMHDGGQRLQFADADAWLERLDKI